MVKIGILGLENVKIISFVKGFLKYLKEIKTDGTSKNHEKLKVVKVDFKEGYEQKSNETKTPHPNRVIFRGASNKIHTIFCPHAPKDQKEAIPKMNLLTVIRSSSIFIIFFSMKSALQEQLDFFKPYYTKYANYFPKTVKVCLSQLRNNQKDKNKSYLKSTKKDIEQIFQERGIKISEFLFYNGAHDKKKIGENGRFFERLMDMLTSNG